MKNLKESLTKKIGAGLLALTTGLMPSQAKAHHPHYYVNPPTTAIAGLQPTTIFHRNIDRFGGIWNRVDYYHPIPRLVPSRIIPRRIIIQTPGIIIQQPAYPFYVLMQPRCGCSPYYSPYYGW